MEKIKRTKNESKQSEYFWTWHPNIGVGEFSFGENIVSFKSKWNISFDTFNSDIGWSRYEIKDWDFFISTEKEKIVALTSYKLFFFKKINLIGEKFKKFLEFSQLAQEGESDIVEYDNGDVQEIYDFQDGLQLYIEKGNIVCASCHQDM